MLTNKDKRWIKDLIHNNTSKKVIKKKTVKTIKTRKTKPSRSLGESMCDGGCDQCPGGC